MMRPFFPFYGSKWNLARRYGAPTRDVVVEPFAGSAAYSVFHAVYSVFHAVPRAVLLDADPILAGVWRYLISVTADEIMALPDLPNVGDTVDDFPLPQEAKWLIGFWLNRASASPKRARTAYSARTDRAQLNWGPRAKERIASQLDGIRDWEVIEGGYSRAPDIEATWFIDPPYLVKGRYYRHSFDRFEDLGEWSLGRRGEVIVCEGESAEWLPFAPLGEFKSTRGKAVELVYRQDSATMERCPDCGDLHSIEACAGATCSCCSSIRLAA